MDGFGTDHTSSTSIEPNSPFQGNDVKKSNTEIDFKIKMACNKRLAIKHFMSTTPSSASKTSFPKNKKMADRNKIQTLDVEEQHCLPRSFSFDSKDSILAYDVHDEIKNDLPYDPIKNYLSPRPRFLKYNPNRHREIFARQKKLNRVRRSASYDAGIGFPPKKMDSSVDYEETDIIEHEHEDEHEEEKEEVFDDFEEGSGPSGWNSRVYVKYLIVIIILILTTLTITSMNSPNLSPTRKAIRGFVNLYNKAYGSIFRSVGFDFSEVGTLNDVNHDEMWQKDVGDDDNMDSNQLEVYKPEEITEVQNYNKIDDYHDQIWSKNDIGQFQDSHVNDIEEKEELSYELHKHVILKSEEIYSDFDRGKVVKDLEILEMVVDEDAGKEDGNNIGSPENILIKLARFDSYFATLIGVCVLLLATLSIIYYSKKSKISTNNTKYLESFVNSLPLANKTTYSGSLIDFDAVSSSEAKSSYMEFSTDSPSYGSFTVEKKIVKKKKSKKPEVMVSPVRRSSRIHNRSTMSS